MSSELIIVRCLIIMCIHTQVGVIMRKSGSPDGLAIFYILTVKVTTNASTVIGRSDEGEIRVRTGLLSFTCFVREEEFCMMMRQSLHAVISREEEWNAIHHTLVHHHHPHPSLAHSSRGDGMR